MEEIWFTRYECAWFALCSNQATAAMRHPMAPETGIPICTGCRAKVAQLSDDRSESDILASI